MIYALYLYLERKKKNPTILNIYNNLNLMLHVFHGMGVYNFFSNILEYVQISKPIIVYIFLKI